MAHNQPTWGQVGHKIKGLHVLRVTIRKMERVIRDSLVIVFNVHRNILIFIMITSLVLTVMA